MVSFLFRNLETCELLNCPETGFCIDLDEKSICRCDEGLAYNASSNLCVAGTIVVISDVKLNQTFLPDYGDRKTTEHVSLAIKLEEEFAKNIDALGLLNVIGIHVVSMKEGSIDVTFALVLKPGTSVNVTRIQEKLRKAMGVTIFVKDGGDAEPIVQGKSFFFAKDAIGKMPNPFGWIIIYYGLNI